MPSIKKYFPGIQDGIVTLDYDMVYSPANYVIASRSSGYKADFYIDGTHDEVEINQALDQLPASKGVVDIISSFVLGDSIKMSSFQKLRARGRDVICTVTSGATFDLIKEKSNASYNRYCEVEGFKFDCSNQTSGNVVNIYAARNNTYYKNWFTAVKGSCINLQGDVNNLGFYNWVIKNEVDGVAGDGITAPAYSEHNYILNNTITFVSGYGVHMQGDSDLIQGNQFDYCGNITILCEFGAGVWRVFDNFIDRPQNHAVVMRSAPSSIVSRNHFGTGLSGKILVANGLSGSDASDNLIVSENMMTTAGAGYSIKEIGGATNGCRYVGNIIHGPTNGVILDAGSTNNTNSNTVY